MPPGAMPSAAEAQGSEMPMVCHLGSACSDYRKGAAGFTLKSKAKNRGNGKEVWQSNILAGDLERMEVRRVEAALHGLEGAAKSRVEGADPRHRQAGTGDTLVRGRAEDKPWVLIFWSSGTHMAER